MVSLSGLCVRRIEQVLHKDLKASLTVLRASMASFLFARAVYSWAFDLSVAASDISQGSQRWTEEDCHLCSLLDKHLAGCFSALSQRHDLWHRSQMWHLASKLGGGSLGSAQGGQHSFKDTNLFGEDMGKYLVEVNDKKKALPSRKKDSKTKKCFSSFHDSKCTSGSSSSRSFKERWYPSSQQSTE